MGAERPGHHRIDVRERSSIADAFADVRPDLVVHLAAGTSLEFADANEDATYLTNTIATKYVALAARKHDAAMVYISTAGVFDGTKPSEVYNEYDQPNPLNVYGQTKYLGELMVKEFLERHYIIRAGWMVGGAGPRITSSSPRCSNRFVTARKPCMPSATSWALPPTRRISPAPFLG